MSRPAGRLTDQVARELILDTEPWLSCEDCFALMDVYVEAALDGPDRRAMPEMAVHLAGCPACAEEAASLLDLVTTDPPPPDPGSTG